MRTTCSLPFKTVIYISKVNNGNLIYRSACQRQAGRSIPELNCWLERFSLIFIIYFRCSILLLVLLVHSSLETIQQEFKFRFNFYLFFSYTPKRIDLFRVDPFRLSCSVIFLEKLANAEACSLHVQEPNRECIV